VSSSLGERPRLDAHHDLPVLPLVFFRSSAIRSHSPCLNLGDQSNLSVDIFHSLSPPRISRK
jgi:hypothetical protein